MTLVCAGIGGCAGGQAGDGPADGGMLGTGTSSASTASATSTASTASTTSATSTTSTTGTVPTTGSATSGSTASVTGSSGATTGGEVCGNGIVELGEQCDDGNDSNLDGCLTTCQVATCTDGVRSGTETDVDCGGACQPCGGCKGCAVPTDCADPFQCGDAGTCTWGTEVTIDWLADCSTDGSAVVTTPNVPAGTYLATAVSSAGTVWDPPYSPPTSGWAYVVTCDGVNLPNLQTPSGVYYATADEAFANLLATSETFDFAGGTLSCGRLDSTCSDNHGTVVFDMTLSCQ